MLALHDMFFICGDSKVTVVTDFWKLFLKMSNVNIIASFQTTDANCRHFSLFVGIFFENLTYRENCRDFFNFLQLKISFLPVVRYCRDKTLGVEEKIHFFFKA